MQSLDKMGCNLESNTNKSISHLFHYTVLMNEYVNHGTRSNVPVQR